MVQLEYNEASKEIIEVAVSDEVDEVDEVEVEVVVEDINFA